MILELKRYEDDFFNNSTEPYRLGGVEDVTDKTEYGGGYFAITIFDRRVFFVKDLKYVRCVETGKCYVDSGKWVDIK